MNLTYSLNDLVLFQIALFAILSPFAVIGPYSTMTEHFTRPTRIKIGIRLSIYSTFVLILVAWGGEFILKILGISLESLEAAGGLVLILSSLPMIQKGESPRRKLKANELEELGEQQEDQDEGWESTVISPLVFPLTIGAGSISIVITQVGSVSTIADRLIVTACLLLHGLIILGTYLFSFTLSGKLKNNGTVVITRLGGIILLCLAFEIFANGLLALFPGLAG